MKRLAMVLGAVLLGLGIAASTAAASAPFGALTQLPGKAGCVSGDGSSDAGANTCAIGRELVKPESVTVSPDGRFVYVGSYQISGDSNSRGGLAVFSRNLTTGAVTQVSGTGGCYTRDGSSDGVANACTKVRGIGNGDGNDFLITSDGHWAYMVNQQETGADPAASIVIFSRNPTTGVLTQLSGTAGCLSLDGSSQDGANTCQTLATLVAPNGLSISANQRFLYVTDYASAGNRIHVLSRNTSTGALNEVQCLAEGTITGCTTARDLGNARTLVLSPDGKHAYSADYGHSGISIFDRSPTTGLLTQKAAAAGCITEDGKDNTGASTCGTARELDGAEALSIAPDGHTLYVAAYKDVHRGGLDTFHVGSDGTLTELGGTSGCASENGNDTTGAHTCATVSSFDQPFGTVISPDGRNLYVSQFGGGVESFSLNPSTGAATQLPGHAGCVTTDGSAGACAIGTGLTGTYQPAISPDGQSVYIASYGSPGTGALSVFKREAGPTCTAASVSTAYGKSVTVPLRCVDADGDPVTVSIASGPHHGKLGQLNASKHTVAYTPAKGFHGTDSFTFKASDGTNSSTPATATVTVKPLPRPALTKLSQSHKKWHRGASTEFSFTLNEAARVTFSFTRRGSSVGKMTKSGHAGKNTVTFKGHLGGKALAPGHYSVSIVARNKWGKSKPRHLSFTILK